MDPTRGHFIPWSRPHAEEQWAHLLAAESSILKPMQWALPSLTLITQRSQDNHAQTTSLKREALSSFPLQRCHGPHAIPAPTCMPLTLKSCAQNLQMMLTAFKTSGTSASPNNSGPQPRAVSLQPMFPSAPSSFLWGQHRSYTYDSAQRLAYARQALHHSVWISLRQGLIFPAGVEVSL